MSTFNSIHTPFVRHPVQMTEGKIRCEKSAGKSTEMNKTFFFVWNI